jgi:hypothetical protein
MHLNLLAAAALQATAAVPDEQSAPIIVLLVGIGAVVGVIVGLIPALVAAMLLGYLPTPSRARRRGGMLVEPPRAAPPVVAPPPPAAAPAPVARHAPPEIPAGPIEVLAQARHQSVYDAAYAEQSERVETLRAAIGGRLRKSPAPPAE